MGKKAAKVIPNFATPIFETHCHLDYLNEEELEETLIKASEYGVNKIVTIAVSPDNLSKVVEISDKYEQVYFTLGIHPHEAKNYDDNVAKNIKELSQHAKNVAIGEIGLDYHYDYSPRGIQLEAFSSQLDIAKDLSLPVIIHSREADEDMSKILKEKSVDKGVIHSFTSSMSLAEEAIDRGLYLGFNGIITFNSAQAVRNVLKITPLKQILLETDAPYLTPTPFRGVKNAPYYLPLIAQKVAEVKEMPVEEIINICYENSMNFFFKST